MQRAFFFSKISAIITLMQKIAIKTKPNGLYRVSKAGAYNKAWGLFGVLSKKLNKLWKTKKNTFEILREERRS